MPSHPSVLSRIYSSRNFFHNESTTPETPKPSNAVEIIKKPKWYQSVTENTRVSDSSNNKVEKEIKKIPKLYLDNRFMLVSL